MPLSANQRAEANQIIAAMKQYPTSPLPGLMRGISIVDQIFSPFNDPKEIENRRRAAVKTMRILEKEGLPCAIFGSMACKLYGNERGPHDVDILVLPPPSRHDLTLNDIKNIIIAASPEEFGFLGPSSNRTDTRPLYLQAKIRIDIALPGMMNLPALSPAQITWMTGTGSTPLPVLPFDLLLFQKLQAWDDHRNAPDGKFSRRVSQDVDDILWMLREGVHQENSNRVAGLEPDRPDASRPSEYEWRHTVFCTAVCTTKSRKTYLYVLGGFTVGQLRSQLSFQLVGQLQQS
ncbi:uncharacterized protein LACBIDRAFT_313368 [Laccaria bicolor S238N-H82]|uniref:Predicted protein n=1 Tax=Laccaria bicolor (strain S238N-H82 / ATCC MYA-4686) TaxID=486041 RepID=B0DY62_LACBS|nr:uncharacterized protein LACBIDRAFT_313368 [Laccaria bicolor S238N-H82]EDR00506.1 predicted protein [Laccaria bicolor S238N-H82]|eukprot:XP_001888898.1 predicted protein [Laccaria bicolor S238N-H82]